MKAGYGWVIIKPLRDTNYFSIQGTSIYLDTSFQKEKHSITCGEVIYVPSAIDESLMTDIEIKEGDMVYFHYLSVINAIRDEKYYIKDGEIYYAVKYESLYLAKREDEIICLNSHIMVRPKMIHTEEQMDGIYLPDEMLQKEWQGRGTVIYAGKPLKNEKQLCKVGDEILYQKWANVPLEYPLHQTMERLFRIKYDWVMAVV